MVRLAPFIKIDAVINTIRNVSEIRSVLASLGFV